MLSPVFTREFTGSGGITFDDTDYTGYITPFGTYVLFDSSSSNQDFASLTYPKTPMYANVFVSESDATVGEGGAIGAPLLDTEVAGVNKNLCQHTCGTIAWQKRKILRRGMDCSYRSWC